MWRKWWRFRCSHGADAFLVRLDERENAAAAAVAAAKSQKHISHIESSARRMWQNVYNNFVIQRARYCGVVGVSVCVSARRGRGLEARRLPSDAPKPLREPPRRDQCWEPAHGTSTLFIRLLVGYAHWHLSTVPESRANFHLALRAPFASDRTLHPVSTPRGGCRPLALPRTHLSPSNCHFIRRNARFSQERGDVSLRSTCFARLRSLHCHF